MSLERLLMTVVTVLALSIVGPPGVRAQPGPNSPVASCLPGWEWSQNSLGQDPCSMVSSLECGCRHLRYWTIPPNDVSTEYYSPPSSTTALDLQCDCNTIIYSLYQACSTCQNASQIPWHQWYPDCLYVYVSQLPFDIPPGTAIPQWAFFNVSTLPIDEFNKTVAESIGRYPEATPTTTISSTRTSSLSSTSSPSMTKSSSSINKSTTEAIVGGVVGGITPLIIVVAVVAFIFYRRRQSRVPFHIEETPNYHGTVVEPAPATADGLYPLRPNSYGLQARGLYGYGGMSEM